MVSLYRQHRSLSYRVVEHLMTKHTYLDRRYDATPDLNGSAMDIAGPFKITASAFQAFPAPMQFEYRFLHLIAEDRIGGLHLS